MLLVYGVLSSEKRFAGSYLFISQAISVHVAFYIHPAECELSLYHYRYGVLGDLCLCLCKSARARVCARECVHLYLYGYRYMYIKPFFFSILSPLSSTPFPSLTPSPRQFSPLLPSQHPNQEKKFQAPSASDCVHRSRVAPFSFSLLLSTPLIRSRCFLTVMPTMTTHSHHAWLFRTSYFETTVSFLFCRCFM